MSGGGARVSIPGNVRKVIGQIKEITAGNGKSYSDEFVYSLLKECNMDADDVVERLKLIRDIKEIAKKHSLDDIHTMLKECNLDPNEAAQRLLYIDTFHEVKKKRDKRNVNPSNGAYKECGRTPAKQWQGARGNHGNYHPSNVSNDGGGRRTINGFTNRNRAERVSSSTIPVQRDKENDVAPHVENSSIVHVNGPTKLPDGLSGRGSPSELSAVSGIYSSASDNVVVPSVNSETAGAVGAERHEVNNHSGFAESVASPLFGSNISVIQEAVKTSEAATEIVDGNSKMTQRISSVMAESLPSDSESSGLNPLSTQTGSPSINSNEDCQSPQLNGSVKVISSDPVSATAAAPLSVPENASVFEESNLKLKKLTLSANMPVIFPDHLQVPETFKKRLTFGSLAAAACKEGSGSLMQPVEGNDVMEVSLMQPVEGNAVMEPSLSCQNVDSIAREDGFTDNPLPPPNVPENTLPSDDSVLSDSSLTHGQSKQEAMLPQGGPQFPLVQPATEFGFGLPPHYVGGLLPSDVPEHQSGNSVVSPTLSPTPSATQPAAVEQNSFAPPPFPFLRHPYAHSYYPYAPYPYYPHYYWSPNAPAPHLVGHSAFPQQPYAAPPGVKFPLPAPFMQGTNAGNLGHFGIPSAYGSYGSSPVGYTADATPNSSSGNEELVASQTKEKNSAGQQGEDSHVWATATSGDMLSLPSYFYSLPQGQHMAFSPGPPALYHHPSQTATVQSSVQPPLHQSEHMAKSVDSSEQQSSSYEQPQHAPLMNWSPLNRENM